MNSPPTPPSFTFYIFQIEIYGGNLSEEIEYKGNYFLNLSLISEQSCSKNQFMVNSWTIHEHSCFKKTPFRLSSFALRLFLSFPLFSSFFLSFPLFLSFFNTRPAHPANSLKTKDLRKRHFWLKFLSQGKPLRLKTLGKNSPIIFLTSPPTLHSTRRRNWPYMLRRETLHHVRFYVGFADQTLHTQHRW